MRKFLLVVALALVACASAAQGGTHEAVFRRNLVPAEDLVAYADARIAALKVGLRLKPEQEKDWPPLEAALREAAKAQIQRIEESRNTAAPTFDDEPLGALQRRAKNMTARAGEFDRIAAAGKPLYDSLDAAQKRRFGTLIRATIEGRMRRMRHAGPGGFGTDQPAL
ncbi:hypothetical protein AMST5_04283 [freshwater sediment metagenome]|jgi:zinc resistance-associated protein|uniref:LTXXQ motif family protein n=1 Tax=freshwater sediment metagenome TaxID=556182 RepID=A0AA48RC71_9ZZZZ